LAFEKVCAGEVTDGEESAGAGEFFFADIGTDFQSSQNALSVRGKTLYNGIPNDLYFGVIENAFGHNGRGT
jgi:hypothetical protein